jgi:hypothetical protein
MNIEQPPGAFETISEGQDSTSLVESMSRIISFSPKNTGMTGISGLRKQAEPADSSPLQSNIVQFVPGSSAAAPVRDVFETVRVIELSRLRLSLKRKRAAHEKNKQVDAPFDPEKNALLALLDTAHKEPNNSWPEVVVVRRQRYADIQTNHAVLAGMIYLGAHLSEDWTEGQEGPRFFVSLREALLDYRRMRASRFEPSVSRA